MAYGFVQVEGQEECDMDFEGTTKITAFNMKEDLEEGHFDSTGNFIFNKKEKVIFITMLTRFP